MRPLNPRERWIMVVCGVLVSVFLFSRLVYLPLTAEVIRLDSRIGTTEQRFLKQKSILARAEPVAEEYNRFFKQLAQTKSDSHVMADILAEIEAVANDTGLPLSDMKPQRVQPKRFFNQFSVTLSLEGELPAIIRFLYSLEHGPHRFVVDELRLDQRSLRRSDVRCYLKLSRFLIAR